MTANMEHAIINDYLTTQDIAFKNRLRNNNTAIYKKLQALLTNINETNIILNVNEKAICNATDIEVPGEVQTLLSLGPKFALPIQKLKDAPLFHLMAEIESILSTNKNKDTQDRTRCKAINIIQNYMNNFSKHTSQDEPITKFCQNAYHNCKTFFKNNDHLCVLSADKGNRTVIMTKHDYHQKMTNLINDDETYKNLNKDPTGCYQTKNNDIAKRLYDLKLIDEKTKKCLTTYNSICPRIYGQPKAHKPNIPLRPVIPNITAPTYNLAKYITNILKQSITSKYNTASSYNFCDQINQITLPEGYIIASLDVVSLFTNIPRHLVTRNIINNWNNIKTDINLDLFIEMVGLCMEASYFQYQGKYYQQTYGTAMGSPLSPILADIVLEKIINDAVNSLPFHIPFLKKYVDDLFIAIPENSTNQILEIFNKQEERIQFTMESESDRKLAYLDVLVIRKQNQSLTTEWYTKPIASGRMLNYHSFHQMRHKINTANNFIHRVNYLSTNMHKNERNKLIHTHLHKNGYPNTLINRLINTYAKKRKPERASTSQSNNIGIETNSVNIPTIEPNNRQIIYNNTESYVTQQPPISTEPSQHNNNPAESYLIQPPVVIPPLQNTTNINTTGAYLIQSPPNNEATFTNQNTADIFPDREPALPHHNTTGGNHSPSTSLTNVIDLPQENIPGDTRTTDNQQHLQKTTYLPMIYIPSLTDNIIKLFRKWYPDVTIATRQHLSVNSIHSKVKDPVKKEEKSNLVYKINCLLCPKLYIGRTSCRLNVRLAGHKSNVNKMHKIYADNTDTDIKLDELKQKTALIAHCIQTKHNFDFTNTTILDQSNNAHTLAFLEMAHIKTNTNAVNLRTDVNGLNTAYAALIDSYAKMTKR